MAKTPNSSQLYKFQKNRRQFLFGLLPGLFGTNYHIVVSDSYGDCFSDPVPEAIEQRMYYYMRDRGFNVKWVPRHGGYVVINVRGKAQEAQFAMINVGVLDIEPYKSPKATVFKV
jgi:hypothetical protein